MKFSQRMGITPISKEIQLDGIDDDLRNGLWNIYSKAILEPLRNTSDSYSTSDFNASEEAFTNGLWHNFFKLTFDSAPRRHFHLYDELKKWFYAAKWDEIYDFIEYSCSLLKGKFYDTTIREIEGYFNAVLEKEFSGYRFIEGHISPIINQHEIQEVKDALNNAGSHSALKGCNTHLDEALNKLSDRKNTDYRNSIKESISAVESLAKVISGKTSDTLNSAIDRIKGKLKIHRNLEQGLKSLYNYTSDGDGIRHSLMDESNCDFEDAKFMLVSCSAFINYLIVKANKAGIVFGM